MSFGRIDAVHESVENVILIDVITIDVITIKS
jgi:hypothetical protein